MSNFTAQLGNINQTGFLPLAERSKRLPIGQNPYVTGPALAGNSPVFYGREYEHSGILGALRTPEKPQSVSIVGERRIGKSSLLNQIYQALAPDPQVVTIRSTTQDWPESYTKSDFFKELHQTIGEVLQVPIEKEGVIDNYQGFSRFIQQQAKKYRFVLMIDEFDKMTYNRHFDAELFTNLRALGDEGKYQFAYVLASYHPLQTVCQEGGIHSSKFWNIFGTKYTLGLLGKSDAEKLIQEPMQHTLEATAHLRDCFASHYAPCFKEIFHYAGYHPAFIQIAAREFWEALRGQFEVHTDVIKSTLRDYYRDLWQHKTVAEQEVLIQVAQNKQNVALEDLRERGLVAGENKLFSEFFAEMVRGELAEELARRKKGIP